MMTEDTCPVRIYIWMSAEFITGPSCWWVCFELPEKVHAESQRESRKMTSIHISAWKTMKIYSHLEVRGDTELCKLLFCKLRQRLASQSGQALNNFISSVRQFYEDFFMKTMNKKPQKSLHSSATLLRKLWQWQAKTLFRLLWSLAWVKLR